MTPNASTSSDDPRVPRPVVIRLTGHLTHDDLQAALASAERSLPNKHGEQVGLVFDCSAMTGYDMAARALFVEWHTRHRDRVSAVAVVTDRPLWRAVVLAMGMASTQRMKAFAGLPAAIAFVQHAWRERKA